MEPALSVLDRASRIVIKVGSALVADNGDARSVWLGKLASDIATLRQEDRQIVLVSSGAIALGRGLLGSTKPRKLEEKQAAAALGQPLIMAALSEAFRPHEISVAQSLLTLDDTENRRRWLNARATLETLLQVGAVPVINENDTVATDEIRYGDNDRLAARVAQMISADALILLSDIDGLYSADPRRDAHAKHMPEVTNLTPEIEAMAGPPNLQNDVGSGGMVTKLAAAKIAWAAGCATAITLGDRDKPVLALREGAKATWVLPDVTPDKAREAWLKHHLAPEGEITIDDGAAKALQRGSSLLPVGVTSVSGAFARGAAVAILTADGQAVAKGITAYSSDDIAAIAGLQSDDVEQRLGYRGRPAIVHRNDMVLEG